MQRIFKRLCVLFRQPAPITRSDLRRFERQEKRRAREACFAAWERVL